jgi:hypothetical protein
MKYLKNENRWSLTPDAQLDVRDALPGGNYTVCQNPLTKEYFLEESEPFTLPQKLYGKIRRHGDRILETFRNRSRDEQVGVFLSGTKGSGKTLLAKYVAMTSGMPHGGSGPEFAVPDAGHDADRSTESYCRR